MNKEARDITIENSAFSLTIHWNPDLVITQACVFAACLLAIFVVPAPAVKTLAKVLLAIDVISLLFGLFCKNGKKDGESDKEKKSGKEKKEKKKEEKNSEKPAEVKSNSENHSSMRIEEDKEIKNKLNLATPKPGARKAESAPSPTPDKKEEVAPEPEQTQPSIPDDVKSAFEEFFICDDDDDM